MAGRAACQKAALFAVIQVIKDNQVMFLGFKLIKYLLNITFFVN